mgnify:CR=1 FL=1
MHLWSNNLYWWARWINFGLSTLLLKDEQGLSLGMLMSGFYAYFLEYIIVPKSLISYPSSTYSCLQCIVFGIYSFYQVRCTTFIFISFPLFCGLCRCVDMFMDLGHQKNQVGGQTKEVPCTTSRPFGEFDDLTFIKVSKMKIQGHKRIGIFASNPTSLRMSKIWVRIKNWRPKH